MPNKSIPAIGDSNWGVTLNSHLSQLQSSTTGGINTFEQFSSRPTNLTADDVGKTYLYTHTGNLHQWTGTTWKVLNESVINVKDYGAVGDGVVDDTVAVQFCLDNYNNCYFPSGSYLLNNIRLKSNQTISGNNKSTKLVLDEREGVVGFKNSLLILDGISNIKISDILITCKKWNISAINASVTTGIKINNSSNILIDNLTFLEFVEYAINCTGDIDTRCRNIIISNCFFDKWGSRNFENGHGAIIFNYGCDNCIAKNNTILASITFAIGIWDSYINSPVSNCKALNNTIRNTLAYGIFVYGTGSNVKDILIDGNTISDIQGNLPTIGDKNYGAGIYIVESANIIVTNNNIDNTNIFTTASGLTPASIGASTVHNQLVILNNICRNSNWFGIYVTGCIDGVYNISNNLITNSKKEGLFLADCNNLTVTSNSIFRPISPVYSDIHILRIYNSVISNNRLDSTSAMQTVIMDTCSSLNFTNNNVISTNNLAFSTMVNSSRILFTNNFIISNNPSRSGLTFDSLLNSKIESNFITNVIAQRVSFIGINDNTYFGKSNRLGLNEISNNSTGLTIEV